MKLTIKTLRFNKIPTGEIKCYFMAKCVIFMITNTFSVTEMDDSFVK
jgi:hypothetical protein